MILSTERQQCTINFHSSSSIQTHFLFHTLLFFKRNLHSQTCHSKSTNRKSPQLISMLWKGSKISHMQCNALIERTTWPFSFLNYNITTNAFFDGLFQSFKVLNLWNLNPIPFCHIWYFQFKQQSWCHILRSFNISDSFQMNINHCDKTSHLLKWQSAITYGP